MTLLATATVLLACTFGAEKRKGSLQSPSASRMPFVRVISNAGFASHREHFKSVRSADAHVPYKGDTPALIDPRATVEPHFAPRFVLPYVKPAVYALLLQPKRSRSRELPTIANRVADSMRVS